MKKLLHIFALFLFLISGMQVCLAQVAMPPVIISVFPKGRVGSRLTITGFHFSPQTSENVVYYGAMRASVIAAGDTSLTIIVPDGANYRYITVLNKTTGLMTQSTIPFDVTFIKGLGFAAKEDYITGKNPSSVISGDFNGDRIPDLAVAESGEDSISILFGNSEGNFGSKKNFPTGKEPYGLVMGDFNGDGIPDLAVADYMSDSISVFLGDGKGNFAPRVDYKTNAKPKSITTGDFNGDGKLDLAVANSGSDSLSVFLGKGDGSFGKKTDFFTGNSSGTSSNPISIASGDFNGDRKLDLVVANKGLDNVTIFFGNGDGTFPSKAYCNTNPNPNCVATGDFNGDGKLDLAVTNDTSNANNGVSVFLGMGNGTFAHKVDYQAGSDPKSVTLADLDGDGNLDMVVTDGSSGKVYVLYGKGDGTFAPAVEYIVGSFPTSVATGDFNGDGRTDMVVANYNSNNVSLLKNIPPHIPVISAFTPASGPVGTTVSISGKYFDTTASKNLVYFGATKAMVKNADTSTLTVVVPDGADYRPISVTDSTTGMTGYSTKPFVVTFPGVSKIARKVNYSTEEGPQSITTGDFNRDGIPDLAVTNVNSNTISVLLGKANGTFASKVDYSVIGSPWNVTTGDINGDGILDLLVAENYGTVSVWLGQSNGTFFGPFDYPTEKNPRSIAVGDFNGDGFPDLAVANSGSNTISVLPGIGDGTFAYEVEYPVGSQPKSVATGDFNRDGLPDIAVADSGSNTVSVLLGKKNHVFAAKVDYLTGAGPTSVATGDFNGDSITDLAVANSQSNSVSVLMGKGDGTFAKKVDYSTGSSPESVSVGDINGDGILDLVVANAKSNTVSVLLGKGDGTFESKVDYAAGNSPSSVTTGDFNGDGKADLVVTNFNSDSVSVLNTIWPPSIKSFSPVAGPVGTMDTIIGKHFNKMASNNEVYFGATKAKVAAVRDTSMVVMVPDGADFRYITVTDTTTGFSGSSAYPFTVTFKKGGHFAEKEDDTIGFHPCDVTTGDFNGDGITDLAVADSSNDSVSVFMGKKDGTFTSKVSYATGNRPVSVTVSDFNGDGKLDLAVANYNSASVSVFLNKGDGTFASKKDYSTGDSPASLVTGDFNRDGIPDIAVADFGSNKVSVLSGRGDGTFNTKKDYSTGNGPNYVITGDFNGDGKLDLAVANVQSNDLSILLGKGDGTFATQKTYSTGSKPNSVTTGDFNGDNKLDLATANYSGTISVLLGEGDGTFADQKIYTADSNTCSVTTGDFNGDGIPDLAVANRSSDKVSVLLGKGDGMFKQKVDYTTGTNPQSIATGDFNGDGKTDLVVANGGSTTVSVYRSAQYGSLIWNGSVSANWSTADNWDKGIFPDSSWDVDIPAVPVQPMVSANLTSPAGCNNITIETGASLTVDAGKALTVYGNLINNDTLIIASDTSGNGSLIVDSTLSGNGIFIRQQYIPNDSSWHLIASSSQNDTIVGSDFVPSPASGLLPTNFNFYSFDQSQSNPWINIRSSDSTVNSNFEKDFIPGKGYLVAYPDKYGKSTLEYKGPFNIGNISAPALVYASDAKLAGWNLIGNPYTSAIDWGKADHSAFTDNFAYVYDPNRAGGGGYIDVDGSNEGAYLAPGQAFFVNVSKAGNFTFTRDMQTHNIATNLKNTSVTQNNGMLVLRISSDSLYDETTIRLLPGTELTRDREDALELPSFDSLVPQLYSYTTDSVGVSVNSYPFVGWVKKVQLGTIIPSDGSYTISLRSRTGNFTWEPAILEDLSNGIKTDLTKENYTFNGKKSDTKRFILITENTTGVNDYSINRGAFVYSYNRKIYIQTKDNQLISGNVELFNILGQVVYRTKISETDLAVLRPQLKNGIYILRLLQKNGQVITKELSFQK